MPNKIIISFAALLCTCYCFSFEAKADERIVVIGWNAESGDANPNVVAARIAQIDGCDIWGISEVKDSIWAEQFETAAEVGEGADFKTVLGTTGGGDQMQIIYDSERFELIGSFELHRINVSGTVRAPLVAHLRITGTDIQFLFMVNHLYRTRSERRHEQARLLNRWGGEQTLPIIAVGDYNFDWHVEEGRFDHDEGYDEMVADGEFNWIRPSKLKKTQANPRFNSILDFVFLGGNSWTWKAKSTILPRDTNDMIDERFSDDDQTSDHRPVRATITISR